MGEIARPERLQIMLTHDELRALDDWRFANRMPSRAAAIRDLLRRGLNAEGVNLAEPGKASGSFGVLGDNGSSAAQQNGESRTGSD